MKLDMKLSLVRIRTKYDFALTYTIRYIVIPPTYLYNAMIVLNITSGPLYMQKSAISPTRQENYPEWYQQVIAEADLAEVSPVRGCMVIKPWGYGIWERVQKILDERIKETGHVNAYFPLLIPLSLLEREAKHVEGFAKECAVVTHHRLISDGKGGLKPDGELEEPYVIRPTSETIIGTMYSKWVQSYRDLPILLNQWANVMRWEMRTRLFLRTAEFLWQEGHTAHATANEAEVETKKILNLYQEFVEGVLAMPVIVGEKTEGERFPGAVNTYCMEAMMQDGKALQAGTSHFLGQNFSKGYDIKFTDQQGDIQHAWTTSWGVSTRLIGGIIMTHSDDNGLVLPPQIAPQQIIILPIYKKEEDKENVLFFCEALKRQLQKCLWRDEKLRVQIDTRDMAGGEKNWQWIKKGVPIRLEIGPRDIAEDAVCLYRRDQDVKARLNKKVAELVEAIPEMLEEIQTGLFARAVEYRRERSVTVTSRDEFEAYFSREDNAGFAHCYAIDSPEIEQYLKPLKVSARCIPLAQDGNEGTCIFTGQKTKQQIVFARAY